MFRIYLIFYFTLIFAISATDYDYPTLINPDGTIQPREFSKEQRSTFDSLKKEIKYFHSEITKILPYLVRNGKVKNNVYTKEVRNFTEMEPGRDGQHFVRETFVLNLSEGRLNSISFLKKRTRINTKMEKQTTVRSISNEITNEEMTGVKLQIDTHTNYTESNAPISKVFNMSEIPSPGDRIKLLRSYRIKVEEALRELDKIIDHKMINDKVNMSNTLNEIEE